MTCFIWLRVGRSPSSSGDPTPWTPDAGQCELTELMLVTLIGVLSLGGAKVRQ
jgi:hypothetical protein